MLASIGSSIEGFLDAAGDFFSSLGEVGWFSLLLGLLSFLVYLTLRSRAFFHTLRAAYPGERIPFWKIWGAYIAAYGFNNVVPARGGDVIKLFLVKTSVPNSTYPAVGAAFFVEAIFDLVMGVFILTFASVAVSRYAGTRSASQRSSTGCRSADPIPSRRRSGAVPSTDR